MMKLLRSITILIGALFSTGCTCSHWLTFNIPSDEQTYCNFRKLTGLRPTPGNVDQWIHEEDQSDYRVFVGKRVILYGMKTTSPKESKEYAKLCLKVYHELLNGNFGIENKAKVTDDGRLYGWYNERQDMQDLAKWIYRGVMKEIVLADGNPKESFSWVMVEMRKIRRFSYFDSYGFEPTTERAKKYW